MTSTTALPDRVRTACAWVAERASAVEIDREALARSAAGMADDANEMAFGFEAGAAAAEERERMAALITCQGAINFGSGWWPTIRKRDGRSGFSTIAAALAETFCESPWSARELTSLDAREVADVLGQDADHPLMELYARTLRDVGDHVAGEHSGRFSDLLATADGSAVALAGLLARWDAFADASIYQGREVPFFKRAQILAADVYRARLAQLGGIDRLTAFADNLVPHVLRVDGVLKLAPALRAKIDGGELLVHGSPAEVELRACAVHAVELLASAVGGLLCPAEIDQILWNRGQGAKYKGLERPRCRTTAY